MNVDPSGNVAFTIAGIGLGISAARSAQSRYNAGVAFAGRAALGFIADNLALVAWLRLSATARNGLPQFPQAQYEGDVHSNTNYVHIKGARITADQAFARILEFNRSDYQPGAPAQPLNSVGNIGDKLTWTMAQFPLNVGQADFDVRVDQLDRRRRFVSVVTLGGHPLSGFRFWEVRAASGNSNEFTIVTGAVEHNTTLADGFKANVGVGYDNGNLGVLRTWKALLESMANLSGGSVDTTRSLIGGRWDDTLISDFKSKVNWRYD